MDLTHFHLSKVNRTIAAIAGSLMAAYGVTLHAANDVNSARQANSNPATMEHRLELTKASEMLGKNIVDSQNKKVGKIKDMAIDVRNNRINYVVVSTGGIAGMGDKLHAVPSQAIRATADSDKATLTLSPQVFNESPTLPDKGWITAVDQKALGALYQRAGVNLPSDSESAQVLPASGLIGRDVIARQDGQDERTGGKVEDLAIDLRAGRVPFAVISMGPMSGTFPSEWVPVPTSLLSKGPEQDMVRIDATGHQIVNARHIDKDNWIRILSDASTAAKLYAGFGATTPYWTQAASDSSGRAMGGARAPSETMEQKGTSTSN